MDLNGILNKNIEDGTAAECIKKVLEEDLERLIWEMNFRLLSQQGLRESILWVEAVEVTQVSVCEKKRTLFGKLKDLCRRLFGHVYHKRRKEGRRVWQQ